MENEMKRVLLDYYNELQKLPKPQASKIGGTYYGSTQLFQHIGNHLDFVENENHTSYGYGGINVYYKDACFLRIGRAYKFSTKEIVEKLIEVYGKRYDPNTRLSIIEDNGTNFSVVGFGTICN